MYGKRHFGWRSLALPLLLNLLPPVAVIGATVQVSTEATGIFLRDFTPAAWTLDGAGEVLIEPGQGIVFAQIDFSVKIDDLAGPPDEVGFGNVVFDVELTGGASDFLSIGWFVPLGCEGENCPPPSPPTWADNTDMGIHGDLIDIVVGVAPRSFGPIGEDPRRTLGQDEPELMGSVFAAIDSDLVGDKGRVGALITAYSTYDENLLLARDDGTAIGEAVVLRIVPEPAALGLALAAGGLLVLAGRPRRNRGRHEFGYK